MEEEKIILFYGAGDKYGYFSNFAMYPIVIEGKKFICNEQYIMWSKAKLFNDKEAMTLIMKLTNPVKIKQAGRGVKGFNEKIWAEKVNEVADTCNMTKFATYKELGKLLLETGEAIIAEASPTDCIWGIGVGVEEGKDRSKWRGKNLLGESLMRVRTVLKG